MRPYPVFSNLKAFVLVVPQDGICFSSLFVHSLDFNSHANYLRKSPLSPPCLLPIHPHRSGFPHLYDLVGLYFPFIALRTSSGWIFISVTTCLLPVSFLGHEVWGSCLVGSLLYLWYITRSLAHSKHTINTRWVNEYNWKGRYSKWQNSTHMSNSSSLWWGMLPCVQSLQRHTCWRLSNSQSL